MRAELTSDSGLLLQILPPRFIAMENLGKEYTPALREQCLAGIQRLRGNVYLQDGAISQQELDASGRHQCPLDDDCWHLFLVNRQDQIQATIRVRQYTKPVKITDLHIYRMVERMPDHFRQSYTLAIEDFMANAWINSMYFSESGGWAVDEHIRNTSSAAMLPFAGWALHRLIGHAQIAVTATTRHRSADILRRMGGFALRLHGIELGPVFDTKFGCDMQPMGFDSRYVAKRFEPIVANLVTQLKTKLPITPLQTQQVKVGLPVSTTA